jgi:hypothetical protein
MNKQAQTSGNKRLRDKEAIQDVGDSESEPKRKIMKKSIEVVQSSSHDNNEEVESVTSTTTPSVTVDTSKGISEYTDKDVLSGRGGGTNLHAVSNQS